MVEHDVRRIAVPSEVCKRILPCSEAVLCGAHARARVRALREGVCYHEVGADSDNDGSMGFDFVSFGEQRDIDDWWFNKVVICHAAVDPDTVAIALSKAVTAPSGGKALLPEELNDALATAAKRVTDTHRLKAWGYGSAGHRLRPRLVPEHVLCVPADAIRKSDLYRFWRHTDDGEGSISVLVFIQDTFSVDDDDNSVPASHRSGTEFWAAEHFENPLRGPACEILPCPGSILLWDGLTMVHRAKVPVESCPRTVATATIHCGASAPQLFRLNTFDTLRKLFFDAAVKIKFSLSLSTVSPLLAPIIVAVIACRCSAKCEKK